MMRRGAFLLVAALALSGPSGAAAQQPPATGGRLPVEVEADQSIELHEQQRAYVARGKALATRGTSRIAADVLVAYYRDLPTGGTEVYRMLAEGNVSVVTPTQQVFGERAVYDVDLQVAVMTGGNLKLITRTDVVTARDSLEYWERERLAVARGDALSVRGANRVSGDSLVALLRDAAGGGTEVHRIDAEGNVVIVTQTDVVHGREAVYDVDRNVATVLGDVRATRGGNQVNGEAAEVDFATGISRMLRTAQGQPQASTAPQRVRGLFVPGQQPGQGAAPAPAQPPRPVPPAPAAPARPRN
jgi:lipopolysaccharide export system protein LptA